MPDRFSFVEGKPYVYQDVFRGLDPLTGRPDVDPAHKPGTGQEAEFCPDAHGGKTWPPAAFSPKTRMIYVPANNNLCMSMVGVSVHGRSRAHTRSASNSGAFMAPGADHFGEVQAWNVDTGQRVWTHAYDQSSELGLDAGYSWRPRLYGRHERSEVPRVRRVDGQAPLGVSDELRDSRSSVVVHARWEAIRRRGVGMGGDASGMQQRLNILFPDTIRKCPRAEPCGSSVCPRHFDGLSARELALSSTSERLAEGEGFVPKAAGAARCLKTARSGNISRRSVGGGEGFEPR